MPKNKPPGGSGKLKLSPTYLAMEGRDRTCEECGVTQPISFKTFAPNKRAPDGVSPVCRRCQGLGARQKQIKAGMRKPKLGETLTTPTGWPNPTKRRREYWERVETLTDRLYELANRPAMSAELAAVKTELNKVTRLHSDPAGGGEQHDQELAFRTFTAVVSRLISGWVAYGEIHDQDIIPALMSDADQVLVLASRNSGKSALVEIYCAWLLHRDPLDIIGVVSGASKRAKRTLRTVRNFIAQCPLLSPLEPNDECLDSSDQFQTPQGHGHQGSAVSFSSFGVASSMVGHRFNRAILDDIESKRDRTPNMQENLELLSSDVFNVLNPQGRIVALGTPQLSGSIYARWAANPEWELHRALLFEELPPDEGEGKRTQLRSRWLARWTDEALEQKRRQLPPGEWLLHWCLDLTVLEADPRPLKLRDVCTVKWNPKDPQFPNVIRPGGATLTHLEKGATADADDNFIGPAEVSPETSRWVTTIAAIDPASGTAGNDELGLSVVSITSQGLAVVRLCTGVRGRNATETLTNAASLVHSFYPTAIVCEARADSLFPGQFASVLARRGYPATVTPVQSGTAKGQRIIDAISVIMADQRLIVLEAVWTEQETIKQYTSITHDARQGPRLDDRVDSLAWALTTAAPQLLADESEWLPTVAGQKLEELLRKPIRRGGIREDGLEARMFEDDEVTESYQWKLDRALAIQEEELRDGKVDPEYGKYIETLRAQLVSLRRGGPVRPIGRQPRNPTTP